VLTPGPEPRRRFGVLLVVALGLVGLAGGFLTRSVIDLVSAGTDVDHARQELAEANQRLADLREDDTLETRTARDEALEAGRSGAVTMNTLDYRDIDADLAEWARVTTGALHDQVVDGRAQSRKSVVDARSVTEATALSSAVEEVDEQAGTATVLVAVRVDVTLGDEEPSERFVRLEVTLLRTEDGWKLDGIGQVPFTS
jgi:Mce-associated membrane protein